ncbi:DUF305 domain-containing protein [Mycobacterium sp. M26]|uniref:DUF305 domain-containing protein n=1 Tax=Mycobacterium sp. M26 TaxID=1762962 RepID=UPI00073ECC55|nr:DUF305 domain-containing protein [Mycobacterium sp. M26]
MNTRSVAVAGAAVAALITLTACGGATKTASTPPASAAPAASSTTAAPNTAAHNNADVMFTQHMIPHHQQAIEMSDDILGRQGIDPRVTALAQQIKAAQGPEIQQMQGWLSQWGVPAMPMTPGGGMDDMPGHGGMTGMPGMPGHDMGDMGDMGAGMGMMSEADMAALRDAQGPAASRLFLTQMIQHHQGAIIMAQREIGAGQYPATIALAKSIAESQQKEIDEMNKILASL